MPRCKVLNVVEPNEKMRRILICMGFIRLSLQSSVSLLFTAYHQRSVSPWGVNPQPEPPAASAAACPHRGLIKASRRPLLCLQHQKQREVKVKERGKLSGEISSTVNLEHKNEKIFYISKDGVCACIR